MQTLHRAMYCSLSKKLHGEHLNKAENSMSVSRKWINMYILLSLHDPSSVHFQRNRVVDITLGNAKSQDQPCLLNVGDFQFALHFFLHWQPPLCQYLFSFIMSTKHFFPATEGVVVLGLESLVARNSHLALDSPHKVVYSRTHNTGKVTLISGGGSGHGE